MSVKRKNYLLQITYNTLYNTAVLSFTGPFMQTFLHTIVSEDMIYIHATVIQAVNVVTTLLISRFADKGNIFRRYAYTIGITGLLFLFYLPLCFMTLPADVAFTVALAVGAMQSFFAALHTICSYKIPYYIIPPEDYGSLMAISGIVSGIATFGVGALMTYLSTLFPYATLMTFAFPISAVMMVASAFVVLLFKKFDGAPEEVPAKKTAPLTEMFRNPLFYKLIPANLLRGVTNGVTTVLATIALSVGYGETTTTAMVSLQSVGLFAGSFIYTLLSHKFSARINVLIGCIPFLCLPFIMIPNNEPLMLIAFTVLIIGKYIADYAVPASLMFVVPAEIAGPYNAWRMVLHLGGSVIATAVATVIPIPVLLIVATAFQLFCGVVYAFHSITLPHSK